MIDLSGDYAMTWSQWLILGFFVGGIFMQWLKSKKREESNNVQKDYF